MASRPTKYAHVVKDLPKDVGQDPERFDLVTKVCDEIRETATGIESEGISMRLQHSTREGEVLIERLLNDAKQCPMQNAGGFARAYADARGILAALTGWTASAQLLADSYERLMAKQMETEGVASLRLASGASVSKYDEPVAKVVDKEAFRQWCIENGYERQLRLWPSTTTTIAKERTLAGEAPPDGVEVTVRTIVRLNKA